MAVAANCSRDRSTISSVGSMILISRSSRLRRWGRLDRWRIEKSILHALRWHLHLARLRRGKPDPPDREEDDSLERKDGGDFSGQTRYAWRRARGSSVAICVRSRTGIRCFLTCIRVQGESIPRGRFEVTQHRKSVHKMCLEVLGSTCSLAAPESLGSVFHHVMGTCPGRIRKF